MQEGSEIFLCILFSLGALMSLWGALLSPHLFDWMGVDVHKTRRRNEQERDWSKYFLLSLVAQPVTFVGTAVGLWWMPYVSVIPPAHFLLTLFFLIAVDVVRKPEPWEKGYTRLF